MNPIQRSVDSLQMIYAVIIALAIGNAIQTIFLDTTTKLFIFDFSLLSSLPAFLTFIVIIVPFYQGMNRHLDNCYIINTERHVEGALLFDFLVFFFEAIILYAFSASIKSGLNCFIILGILLFVDVIWGLISHWIHYKEVKPGVIRWSIINFITIIAGTAVFLLSIYTDNNKAWILFLIALVRTVCDYGFSWQFYFPRNTKKV